MSVEPPGPADGQLLWFKADVGITKVGSGVTDWADQGPNGWDAHCADVFGNPAAPAERPVFTDNVINGLPGLLYVDTGPGQAHGRMNHYPPLVTDPVPTAPDAPKTILVLGMRTGLYGGMAFSTYNGDLEFGNWDENGSWRWVFGDPTAAIVIPKTPTSYVGLPLVMEWRYYGNGGSPQGRFWINGIEQAATPRLATPLSPEAGQPGFHIGNVPAFGSSRGWQGYITEVIMYGGTDPATSADARNYLMERAGLISNARPPLQAAAGPSAAIGAAATGHLFRYSPKAFGDQFFNPGQT